MKRQNVAPSVKNLAIKLMKQRREVGSLVFGLLQALGFIISSVKIQGASGLMVHHGLSRLIRMALSRQPTPTGKRRFQNYRVVATLK
jgi:hypothetical protein